MEEFTPGTYLWLRPSGGPKPELYKIRFARKVREGRFSRKLFVWKLFVWKLFVWKLFVWKLFVWKLFVWKLFG